MTARVAALIFAAAAALAPVSVGLPAQHPHAAAPHEWRAATSEELQTVLPARAPVLEERIETEVSSNSGITDGHGHFLAVTVLITAGYAAHGKYSQYLIAGVPVVFGGTVELKAGSYLIGWTRDDQGLRVTFSDAATGTPLGTVEALPSTPPVRVVPIRVWPPSQRSALQIGRFVVPYRLG